MKKCKLPKNHLGEHELVDIDTDWPTDHYRKGWDDREDDGLCHTSEGFAYRWRERCACPTCGDVAIREVYCEPHTGEVHVSTCGICKDNERAAHYARLAQHYADRATEKRKKKQERTRSSASRRPQPPRGNSRVRWTPAKGEDQ